MNTPTIIYSAPVSEAAMHCWHKIPILDSQTFQNGSWIWYQWDQLQKVHGTRSYTEHTG